MIIVEGPDGSGKTTLIKQLQTKFGLEVAPRVVSKDAEALTDLKVWVEQNLAEGFQYKIFDRHRLISEYIYGPLLRKEQQPGFTDLIWSYGMLYKLYTEVDPIVIYCLPSLETVRKNVLGDHENAVVAEHIDGMYAAYVHRCALDWVARPSRTIIWNYELDWIVEMNAIAENEYPEGAHPLNALRPIMNYAKGRVGL